MIQPKYELYEYIKANDTKENICANISKMLEDIKKSKKREEKKNIGYNIFYYVYVNQWFTNTYKRFEENVIIKLFSFLNEDFIELVEFVPHICKQMDTQQQEIYNNALEKYNNKYYDLDITKIYTERREIINDIKKYLDQNNYNILLENRQKLFKLFIKNQVLIDKDKELKEALKKTYLKTNDNSIKYCYLCC